MGAPRRLRKDIEREKVLDRIHDLEQVLVDLGHMRKKRVTRRKKTLMKERGIRAKKVQDIEAQDDEEEEDE